MNFHLSWKLQPRHYTFVLVCPDLTVHFGEGASLAEVFRKVQVIQKEFFKPKPLQLDIGKHDAE